jgi:hypothetical protein
MVFKWMILLLPLVTTSVFAADVYVCEKNGRKEFSQLPCGDNAFVLQTEGEPSSLKLSIPFKPKQITALCKLVIKAKDRAVQSQKVPSRSSSYNYNRNYNYNSQAYRLQEQQRRYDNNLRNTPEAYVLGKIENLEAIAQNSPSSYQLLKELTRYISYNGYEESPMYESERIAAQSDCEDRINKRMRYMSN